MIDTVALQHRLTKAPSEDNLMQYWNRKHILTSGLRRKFICNETRNSHAPRLTLSEDINKNWYLRAEVSIPEWLFGTNTKLPNQTDVFNSLEKLSEYVSGKILLPFDAFTAKTRRVDFTKDFSLSAETKLFRRSKIYIKFIRRAFDELSTMSRPLNFVVERKRKV